MLDFEGLQAREALQQRYNMTIVELRTEPGSRGSRPKFGWGAPWSVFTRRRQDRPDLRDSTDQHQQVTDRAERRFHARSLNSCITQRDAVSRRGPVPTVVSMRDGWLEPRAGKVHVDAMSEWPGPG